MCFLLKTKIISPRGIGSFYKPGWIRLGRHTLIAPTVTGNQREQQKPLLAWFYNRFTVPEHTQLSKCPYNLAYYYSDLDKPQVGLCRGNRTAAHEV